MTSRSPVRTVVVMGVSGCGKSTIGRQLAAALGAGFVDGDDYHSAASVEKMRSGVALTDRDRDPWLHALNSAVRARAGTTVLACSALKRSYRDILRAGLETEFACLAVSEQLARARLGGRAGHFFPESLLRSQFADLEPLGPGEPGVTLDGSAPVAEIVTAIVAHLGARVARDGGSGEN